VIRVIAGELKGRRLETPAWEGLRPTSDRLRETIFNVLAPVIRGARVLDGYAGTGAVGIEALSRGAAHVTFVERDPRAARLVEANLRRCGVGERHAIIRLDVAAAAATLAPGAFDIIFLDPPYGQAALDGAVALAQPLVTSETMLIVEHAARDRAPDAHAGLRLARSIRSGDSALAFYRRDDRGRAEGAAP
jgi:16S rRNA (guanine966-N2)-methyltransferase